MPMMQNTQLYSLVRNIHGNDGQSTFALPNIAGAAPLMFCIALWGEYPQRP
jgi:microcystin-dependent protein